MLITKIEVENWKLFRDAVEFEFSPDINFIVGPNEAGKSTLIEAVSRALYDKHTTRAVELTAVQPWGTSLSPRVAVEFQANDGEYRIDKRFLSSADSTLRKKVGGKWEKIADGDQADKQVCALLDAELYEHGASKPEHRGMTQLLWMPQGRFELPDDLNRATTDKLRSVLGAISVPPKEQEATAEIDRRFGEVFTTKRMDYAKGSRIKAVQEEIAEAEEQLAEVGQRVRDGGQLVHKVEQARIALEKLGKELAQAEDDLAAKREARDKAREHREARIKAESSLNKAKDAYERLDERVTAIAKTEERIAEAKAQLKSAERNAKSLRQESEELARQLEEGQKALAKLQDKRSTLADELRNLRIHYDLVRDQDDLERVQERLRAAQGVLEKLQGIESELSDLQAPNEEELEELRKLSSRLDKKRAALQASSLRVRFQAETAVNGTVENGARESFSLSSGDGREWTSARALNVELAGVGRFSAQGGSDEAADLKEEVGDIEDQLRAELAALGAETVQDAAERSRQHRNLEGSREKLKNQLQQLIPDGEDVAKKDVNRLKTKVDATKKKAEPFSRELSDKLNELDASAQQHMLAERINRVEEQQQKLAEDTKQAEKELTNRQGDKQKKDDAIQKTVEESAELKGQLTQLQNRVDELRDDGLSKDQRLEKQKEALKKYKEAEQFCDALKEEAEEKEKRPEEAFLRAERKAKQLQNRERAKTEQLRTDEGELRSLTEEGLYEKESELMERLTELQEQKSLLQRDADAIKLLKLLKDHFQQKALDSLVEPVRHIVQPNFRRLVGPKYEAIKLDRAMRPRTLTVADWGEEADATELSFGTQEQLAFLVRLALGELLGGDERLAVVLDDPLVNTDPARFDEALGIIQEASRKMQLFILTCHETAYAGLEGNTVELGSY
jgi:DNA repair exonuclease SbcCD ATPase subunit